ncbi:MAG TPA: O-antigen ligase family protein [Bryobacteraceae bacterium]|nr:O-antigen ligase family protein [Bryobacteraceae bacterium]
MPLVVPLVVILLPLLILPGVLFYYDVTPKIAVLLLGAAAATVFVDWRALRQRKWLAWLLAAEALSLIISTLVSAHPLLSLMGSSWRRLGLIPQLAVLVLAAAAASRGFTPKQIFRPMAAAGVPIALYGILQYFGWDPLLPSAAYRVGEGKWEIVRPPATLGHASYFANWLVFVFFAGLFLERTEKGIWKVVGGVSAGMALLGIVLSGTRGALVAVACGSLYLLWRRRPPWRRLVAPAAALAVVLILLIITPPGQQVRARLRWASEDVWGGARLRLWRDSIGMAIHRPAAGFGPEVFTAAFPAYESKALARAYPDFHHESPHNLFLDALVSQGIPGLAIWLGLCIYGLWMAQRGSKQDAFASAVIGASLVGAIVAQQFTAFVAVTLLYFFLMLVLVETPPTLPPRRLALPVAIPVAALLVFFGIRLVAADGSLEAVHRAVNQGRIRDAAVLYPRAASLGMPADLWYSRSVAQAGARTNNLTDRWAASQQAMLAAQNAVRTSEDPYDAWYNLAALYASRNDFAHTEASLRQAVKAAPRWYKPHWMLAQILQIAGRLDEARAEAQTAVDLAGGKHPEVAQTLSRLSH